MSNWVEDVDGDLINLDKMEKIVVAPVADAVPEKAFAVLAIAPRVRGEEDQGDEGDNWLLVGTETECRAHLLALKERLLK